MENHRFFLGTPGLRDQSLEYSERIEALDFIRSSFFVLTQKKTKQKKIQDCICFSQKIYACSSKVIKQKHFLTKNQLVFFCAPAVVIKIRSKETMFLRLQGCSTHIE